MLEDDSGDISAYEDLLINEITDLAIEEDTSTDAQLDCAGIVEDALVI